MKPLTAREAEIVKFVAIGKTNKEVAALLLISPNTVRNRLAVIMQKLNVRNRTELANQQLGQAILPSGKGR